MDPSSASAAASSAAGPAATPAEPASSSSGNSSRRDSSSSSIPLLRENRFYARPPQELLDDLANAAIDYLGEGCDALEKGIMQQAVKRTSRRQDIGKSVDDMFSVLQDGFNSQLSSFEKRVLTSELRLPSHVVVSSELQAEREGFGAAAGSFAAIDEADKEQKEEDDAVEAQLKQLQKRVADAAKLNRAVRTQLELYEADAEAAEALDELLVTDAKTEAKQKQLLDSVRTIASQAAQLRPLHASLTQQFVDTFGAAAGAELTAGVGAGLGSGANASGSGAGAASASDAPLDSMTRQINVAANAEQTSAVTAAVGGGAQNAANGGEMNIEQDAADLL